MDNIKKAADRRARAIEVARDRILSTGIVFALAFLIIGMRLIELTWQSPIGYFWFTIIGFWLICEVIFYILLNKYGEVRIYRITLIKLTTISQEIAANGTRTAIRAVLLFSFANVTLNCWWSPQDANISVIASWVSTISVYISIGFCFSNVILWTRVIMGYYGLNPEEAADIVLYLTKRRIDNTDSSGHPRKLVIDYHEPSTIGNVDSGLETVS